MMFARTARWLRLASALLIVSMALSPARAQDATYSNEQLDQMLAPIALYPDSLLSQVLMASTYPADVAEAVKWSKANPNQKGDAAVKAVESKDWDPAVASLVAFPQALAMMGEKPEWVQAVGDAFLASPEAVMNSVQRLRASAQKAGNLQTTEQQKVIVEQAPQTQQTIIKIEPANPQVVYVPAYNPTVVYGTWPYPSYPPYYWPTPGYAFGSALMTGLAFGTGIAITNALWGNANWGRGDVDINVNRYNNINASKQINASSNRTNWTHNADNRKGVPYRDSKSREQYGNRAAAGGADNRKDFRGNDPGRDASREKAQATLKDRGADPAKGRQELRNDPQARDRAQAATRDAQARDRAQGGMQRPDGGGTRDPSRAAAKDPGRDNARAAAQTADRDRVNNAAQNRGGDNALKGAGNAAQTRQSTDRGNASRQAAQARPAAASHSMPQAGGTRAAAPRASAGGGARAGGGRGR
jgi:hypothetical protein